MFDMMSDVKRKGVVSEIVRRLGIVESALKKITFLGGGGGAQIAGAYVPYTSDYDVYRCDNPGGASTFVGTIATLPGGATLTYNITSGQELVLVPSATNHLAKLRLYNFTRGNYALISNSVAATNTITLTANVPAGWVVGDTIQVTSPTVTPIYAPWMDLEIVETDLLSRSALSMFFVHRSTVAGDGAGLHPTETYGNGKLIANNAQAANIANWMSVPGIKMNGNLISIGWSAAPTFVILRIAGYYQ